MVNLWKKTAVSLLAAALLSGGAPGLSANAGTPVISETISVATLAKDTAETAGKISVTQKGSLLLISGKGALTAATLKDTDFSEITEVQVKAGITAIGSGAFLDQKTIKKVSLPDSVLTIETNAFRGCETLEEIQFGSALKTIGSFAFYRCKSLASLALPDSVKTLETGAFQECTALKTAALGNGVKKLPIQLFRGCTSLETVELNPSLEVIGEQSFCLCSALKNIVIPSGVYRIDKNAFSGCSALSLNLPEDLEDQGDGSYRKRGGLKISGTYLYSEAEKVLTLVNQERVKAGLEAVVMDRELLEGAMTRSAELNVLYSDRRPNGASFDSVSSKAKAENRLIGVSSAREAMEVWMQSDGFKSHILDPEVKSIGVGCFSQGNFKCWVQLFGTEKAENPGSQADVSKVTDIRITGENASFYLDKTSLELEPGKTKTLTVYLKNTGFSQASAAVAPETFQWESSDSSVVSVDENGTLTTKKGGEATITCTSRYGDRQSLSCKVKVEVKLTAIRPEAKTLRLAVGKKYAPKMELVPSNVTNASLTYKSSRPSVVTVMADGKLWARKNGTAVITCSSGKIQTKFTVAVRNYVSAVRVTNAPTDLNAGEKLVLQTKILPTNALYKGVTFQSSDPKIASVTKNGILKANKPGRVKITCQAKYGAGAVKSFYLTVHPKMPVIYGKALEGGLRLAWKIPEGATNCTVYWTNAPGRSFRRLYSGTNRSYTWKNLRKGRTYYFKICAMAKVGKKNVYSPWSKVLEVTVK